VDYFGKRTIPDWPGISAASRSDVSKAIAGAKEKLRRGYLKEDFTQGDLWTVRDERSLHRVLISARKESDSPWRDFPGDTYRKMDLVQVFEAVGRARKEYRELGGRLKLSNNLLLAWAMRESAWNPCASAYGNTEGRSTAVGMLMITRSTYNLYARQALFPKKFIRKYGAKWSEAVLTGPVANMVVAQFILDGATKRGLREKLSAYYNPGNKAAGGRYADKVLAGKRYLDKMLKGKRVDKTSRKQRTRILLELDRHVR
jgi:hypothetical protein